MRQKIQHKSCFKKQGKTPLERIVPAIESGIDSKALYSHCEAVNARSISSGYPERYDKSSQEGEDVERGLKAVFVLPLICLIRIYKALISPWLPPACRFTPSCAEYAETALIRHGLFYGGWLMCYRLLRCQPFCKSGYDPVPPVKHSPRLWQLIRIRK